MRLRGYLAAFASAALAPLAPAQMYTGSHGMVFATYPIQTEVNSSISIKVSSPLSLPAIYGFMPVQVAIENASGHDGTWHFAFFSGLPNEFPGSLESGVDVSVAAGQHKEGWYMVPIPWAGVSAAIAPVGGAGTAGLPTMPPPIPGVWPSPSGVVSTWRIVAASQLGQVTPGMIRRVFSITQTGSTASLPMIPNPVLPSSTGLTLQISPEPGVDRVKRTATVTVEMVPGSSSGGRGVASPLSQLTASARNKLDAAGLLIRGFSISSSTQPGAGATPGQTAITYRFQQSGPSDKMVAVADAKLPAGVDVDVAPSSTAGESIRTVTYRESVPMASLAVPTNRGSQMGLSPAGYEAAARAILAPTRLLERSPGVTESVTMIPMSSSGPPIYVPMFSQTGPAGALLPRPNPSSLPPGVVVNVHPTATPLQVIRTISYLDPALAPQLNGIPPTVLARYELMRRGYLRTQPGVSMSSSTRAPTITPGTPAPPGVTSPSIAGAGGGISVSAFTIIGTLASSSGGPTVNVFTESGPAALLPMVPADSLPANTTVTITPGAIAGEVSRNFIVTGTPLIATVAGGGAVTSTMVTGASRPVFRARADGPGVMNGSFDVYLTSGGMGPGVTPPIAVVPSLENDLRAKLSSLGMRGNVNIASVDLGEVPADWRMWSSFHGVLLRESDFDALDAARRTALLGWVGLGGLVFIEPADEKEGSETAIGAGRIVRLSSPIKDTDATQLALDLRIGNLALSLPSLGDLKFPDKSPLAMLAASSGFSAKSISIFLGIFALIVGPVNLFLLAPAAKRHRLFFTTPLIALVGAVGLVGSIVVSDGLGGDGNRVTVVAIVPGENLAAVFQEQVTQTGVLTSLSFPLENDTLFTALPLDGYTVGGQISDLYRINKTGSGDWFRARWQQVHLLRRLTPTRGRVEVVGTGPAGAPIVESTLTTALQKFCLVDASGDIWIAAEVPTGRKVTLERSPIDTWPRIEPEGSNHLEAVFNSAAKREPGRWTAVGGTTEVAPIASLESIRWKDSPVIYTGLAPIKPTAVALATNR